MFEDSNGLGGAGFSAAADTLVTGGIAEPAVSNSPALLLDTDGLDDLRGTSGTDLFVMLDDGVRDLIRDFHVGTDLIDVSAFAADFDDLLISNIRNSRGEIYWLNIQDRTGENEFLVRFDSATPMDASNLSAPNFTFADTLPPIARTTVSDTSALDSLRGARTAEAFVMSDDGQRDVLREFDVRTDVIDVSAFAAGLGDLTITNIVNRAGTTYWVNIQDRMGQDELIVRFTSDTALDASALTAQNFVFADTLPELPRTIIADTPALDDVRAAAVPETFVMQDDGNRDVIRGFDSGTDLIDASAFASDFSELTITNLQDSRGVVRWLNIADRDGDNELIVRFGDGTVMDAASLTAADFIFDNALATVSGDLTGAVAEDGTTLAAGMILVTDTDPGQSQATVQTDVTGLYGSFSIDAAGNWTYNLDNESGAVQGLNQGQTAQDSFIVTSLDGSALETVVIDITGMNDAPVLNSGVLQSVAGQEFFEPRGAFVFDLTTLSFDAASDGFLGNLETLSSDPDADDEDNAFTLTYDVARPLFGTAVVEDTDLLFTTGGQTLSYLDGGAFETLDLTVTATDRHGATATAIVTAVINGFDDPPEPRWDSFIIEEDTPTLLDVLANDVAVDPADTLEILDVYGAQNGTVAIENGQVLFTPDADFYGPGSGFFYSVIDSDGLESLNPAFARVHVLAQPEAPTVDYKTAILVQSDSFVNVRLSISAEVEEIMRPSEFPESPDSVIERVEIRGFNPDGTLEENIVGERIIEGTDFPRFFIAPTFRLPAEGGTAITVEIKTTAKSVTSGLESSTTDTYLLDFKTARNEQVVTFDIAEQSIWSDQNGFAAAKTFGGSFDEGGGFTNTLVQFDARLAGVGVTTHFSTQTSGNASGSVGLTATTSGQGGSVSGQLSFLTDIQATLDAGADRLQFRTSATPDLTKSNFIATTPTLDYDLSLTDLQFSADFLSTIWGYLHFHTGFSTIKPVDRGNFFDGWRFDADVDLNANPFLGPGGFNLIDYDPDRSPFSTGLSFIEGLFPNRPLNGTYTDPLGNELFDYDLRPQNNFTNASDSIVAGNLFGQNAGQVANVTLDLDSIAASLLGRKNPLGQEESRGQDPLFFKAFYDLLDLDLILPVNYRQANSLDATTLNGTIFFEDGSTHDFVFGERFTFIDASDKDLNGDGNIGYRIEMAPEATFNSDAFLDFNAFDRLQVLQAGVEGGVGGGTYFGVSTPGFSLNQSLGPAFSASRTVVDDISSVTLEQSSVGLAVDTVLSDEFLI